ncbi:MULTISPECIES: ATP-binding protein [unclassified Cryobacterium]|uniref:ATP-binding protein n=1 Tax=unclassified Cryobacterium TaxID=2649013 RepID=UPI001F544784|nr:MULTISPECIES: ATP-binding protein [unclassified Cryobacterium]
MNTPLTTTETTATTVTTATAASVYQQLRGHLTELKLADAADALPRVLDQAQAEGWSLTHALERLLAIEVTATDARRLSGRFRFANLPTGATLDDFDLDAASGIDRNLLAELGTCRYLESAINVMLIGPPGDQELHHSAGRDLTQLGAAPRSSVCVTAQHPAEAGPAPSMTKLLLRNSLLLFVFRLRIAF